MVIFECVCSIFSRSGAGGDFQRDVVAGISFLIQKERNEEEFFEFFFGLVGAYLDVPGD